MCGECEKINDIVEFKKKFEALAKTGEVVTIELKHPRDGFSGGDGKGFDSLKKYERLEAESIEAANKDFGDELENFANAFEAAEKKHDPSTPASKAFRKKFITLSRKKHDSSKESYDKNRVK